MLSSEIRIFSFSASIAMPRTIAQSASRRKDDRADGNAADAGHRKVAVQHTELRRLSLLPFPLICRP